MPPAKNYAFTLSHRRWECEPKSRQPCIKFRLLASTAVLYRPDLIQAPQRRKEGKELKEKGKKKKKPSIEAGKELS